MTLIITSRNFIIGIAIILLIYLLSLAHSILMPFIAGILLAYIFNPIANFLERKKIPRTAASLIIVIISSIIFVMLFVFIIPLLFNEAQLLFDDIKGYFDNNSHMLNQKLNSFLSKFGIEGQESIQSYLSEYREHIMKYFGKFLNGIFTSSVAFINVISLIFILPITTFYFLNDWYRMLHKIDSIIPRRVQAKFRKMWKEINRILSAYMKGQITVCVILGIFYAILLKIVGLKFAMLIGIVSGILTIIPFFGSFIGCIMALITALFQWKLNLAKLISVVFVFALGQFIEGNFITPRLIGNKVNLHPMWIIFALFFGGALFGFWGMIFAVPGAAICGVAIKYMLFNNNESKITK